MVRLNFFLCPFLSCSAHTRFFSSSQMHTERPLTCLCFFFPSCFFFLLKEGMTDLGVSSYESTSSVAAASERDLDRSVRPSEACQAVSKAAQDILKAATRRQTLLKDACKELARLFSKHNKSLLSLITEMEKHKQIQKQRRQRL